MSDVEPRAENTPKKTSTVYPCSRRLEIPVLELLLEEESSKDDEPLDESRQSTL